MKQDKKEKGDDITIPIKAGSVMGWLLKGSERHSTKSVQAENDSSAKKR